MRPGLDQVLARTKEKWTPTHVLKALNEGWAHLFVESDGFAIIQQSKDEWTSEPHVLVWVMWFIPGKAKAKRAELIAWLDEISKKRWKFSSPRMGWEALESECEIERIIWRRK